MNDASSRSDNGHSRAAIDAGRTGDKVPVSDPATVPMNVDAETAGTPTPASESDADLRNQERIARETGADARPISAGFDPAARSGKMTSIPVVAVVAVAAAVVIGVLIGIG